MAKHNLNYKILGKRQLEVDAFDLDYYDVEWTHTDGFPPDTIQVPSNHPPDIQYETRVVGQRKTILDQITVKKDTPESIVMQMLEEKRPKLAKALGISE